MQLPEKEEQIFSLIQNNPFLTQQELAEKVGLSRSAVANMISSLTEKKYLLGRAYVVNPGSQIVCIGGANLDRKLYSLQPLQPFTSNPARSSQSVGGVARNIAENLGRLGHQVSMITVCGNDSDFNVIKAHSESFMDLSGIHLSNTAATGSYTAVLDDDGNLSVALADMAAYEQLTPEVLRQQENQLHAAQCIIADLNCPKATLEFILDFGKKFNKSVAFIPVSSPKMARLPQNLEGLSWLITNCDESETYLNLTIKDEADWQQAVKKWLSLGVKNVVVTHGSKGVLAGNQQELIYQPTISPSTVEDVTGAGDAFCGALIDSWLEKKTLTDSLRYATANAVKTIESRETVRHELTKTQLETDLEELKL